MRIRGDGRVFVRGTVYWCAYYLNGREYRESTEKKDQESAEKFLRDRLKKVGADQLGLSKFTTPRMKKQSVKDLLAALKSDFQLRGKLSAQTASGLKLAEESFGEIKAVAFGPAHVNAYIEKQLAEDYAPASINRITGLVAQAFTLALQEGRLNRAPYIKRLSEAENARQGFTDAATFARVRENLPEELRDFCQFAFSTGWRKGEISGLDWSNVQDGETMIRLRPAQAKNKHGRSVPITGELVDIIRRRREARRLEVDGTTQLVNLVFHRDGTPIKEFRKSWASACNKAGCAGLLFHDLRRSSVTAMIQAKVPQLVAMQISGHRTASMFHRYGIVVEDELRDAMAATSAFHTAQQERQVQQQNVRSISK